MSSGGFKGRHPNSFFLLLNAAYNLVKQDQLPEALTLLDDILEQAPDDAAALTLRGQVYGCLGDIGSALADLGRSVEINPNSEEAYFNYAVAHLHAGNGSEALAALSRVLQLTPNNRRARAWRGRLAFELGLNKLDQVAQVMEHFAYSQCGPGRGWKVELREMYRFQPNRSPESFNAATLDLCQTPQAFIQVAIAPTEYIVKLNVEKHLPDVPQMCLADVISETIPAQHDVLLNLLNSFVDEGILVKVSNQQLRYNGRSTS